MKRALPPDITELDANPTFDKPIFISKKDRNTLSTNQKSTETERKPDKRSQTQFFSNQKSEPKSTTIQDYFNSGSNRPPKRKRNRNKFEFSWKEEEDTMKDSMVLVEYSKKQNEYIEEAEHCSVVPLDKMNDRLWRIYREDYGITVTFGNTTQNTSKDIPRPLRSWNELEGSEILKTRLLEKFKKPTAIQMQMITIAESGRDGLALAQTGSGKTLAYIIPILLRLQNLPRISISNSDLGPHCVVLAPTRELALQIRETAQEYSQLFGMNVQEIVGGRSMQEQTKGLVKGDIVIATPGRLVDLLRNRYIVLQRCNTIVLDEADRMVELGFEQDVKHIFEECPRNHQTLMFSATMPKGVQKLAMQYLSNYLQVVVGSKQIVDKIEQRVEYMSKEYKYRRLGQILGSSEFSPPIIIFTNQKSSCQEISDKAYEMGYRTGVLHSGKSQQQREQAINGFRDGYVDILIATDVAGRGIDIKNISLVINYDMPTTIESYTHRIGRTGRAGRKGCAITFLTSSDSDIFGELKALLVESNASVPIEISRAGINKS